jgi:hypothetical protein
MMQDFDVAKHFPQNMLSPRFINKAKRPNRYKVMMRTSYKADQRYLKKYRINGLATNDTGTRPR